MRRGRARTAWQARSRTSSATTASGTSCARSPRSRRGRAAPGAAARRSSSALLRIGYPQVQRLDLIGGAELARELRVEARSGQVARVVVRRDVRTALYEHRPIAESTVAHAERVG